MNQDEIQTFANMFEYRERGDTRIVVLKDEAPEWCSKLVREIHGDMLPDDWKYLHIYLMADGIAEDGFQDEHEVAESLVDVYNSALTDWLASHGARQGYCDEADEQGLVAETADIIKRIQMGQYLELLEIYQALESFEVPEDQEVA